MKGENMISSDRELKPNFSTFGAMVMRHLTSARNIVMQRPKLKLKLRFDYGQAKIRISNISLPSINGHTLHIKRGFVLSHQPTTKLLALRKTETSIGPNHRNILRDYVVADLPSLTVFQEAHGICPKSMAWRGKLVKIPYFASSFMYVHINKKF